MSPCGSCHSPGIYGNAQASYLFLLPEDVILDYRAEGFVVIWAYERFVAEDLRGITGKMKQGKESIPRICSTEVSRAPTHPKIDLKSTKAVSACKSYFLKDPYPVPPWPSKQTVEADKDRGPVGSVVDVINYKGCIDVSPGKTGDQATQFKILTQQARYSAGQILPLSMVFVRPIFSVSEAALEKRA
ncbi:hypothetical protein J4E83_003738 [Alternaria metachromatica]|uniref:uncharacterized protein n=1 Tax=Alternaria metachromatica TaxID=283354 RepID=UPI0020C20D20|nr:uncharacterized protein J4E83_003738 [Alternaria metachromatica]KAI4626586.1 hypothetical protein J4E83_003738 [Alternaria metachromatica]